MDRYRPSNDRSGTDCARTLRGDTVDTSLPKNFDKPLTCFFWHQNGRCNKREDDCAYAHWNTGNLAAAPISVPGHTAMAVAGKNARNVDTFDALTLYPIPTLDIHNQVQGLNAWEHELQKRERNVREREDEIERMIRAREAELRLRERRVARRERAIRRGSEAAMQGRRRSSGSG